MAFDRERATGLVLAGSGVAVGIAALGIGEGLDAASWGPRTVPLLAAAALVAAGLADAASSSGRAATPHVSARACAEKDVPAVRAAGDPRLPLALFGVAVLYALLMARTGYLVSTALTAPAAFALFGLRRPAALLAAALLCPTVLHVAFFVFLGVFPPRGAWFDTLGWLPP